MISPKIILSTIYRKYLPEKIRKFIHPVKDLVYPYIHRFYHILADIFPTTSLLNDKETLAVFITGKRRDTAFLLDRMFQTEPDESLQGRKFIFNIPSIDSSPVNMVLIEADRCFARFFTRRGFFAIPEWVLFTMDISAPIEKIIRRNKSSKNDFRKIGRYQYTYEETSDKDKLHLFYHTMYLPYISSRYGRLTVHTPLHEMEDILQNGKLLLVKKNHEFVSGMLIERTSSIPIAAYLGIRDGSLKLLKEGALAAVYYYTILWAKEQGYHRMNFGHCRPFLHDGVFLYKKKLGMSIQKSTRKYRMLYLSIRNFNPYLAQFLACNPFVHENRGLLKGLVFIQNGEPFREQEITSLTRKYGIPGLVGFTVIPPDGAATQM